MYTHVFIAGTFDALHEGHKAVLTRAFAEGERVTVGLTPDTFVRNIKHKEQVKSFEDRKKGLVAWLRDKGWLDKAQIIAIADQYEPAASDASLDALVVTSQNRATGEEINAMRRSRGLSALSLIGVPIVPAQDGVPISSTRMRKGEIDSAGKLTMPEVLRMELGKPLGRVLSGLEVTRDALARRRGKTIVTVGDVVTKTLLDAGVRPNLSIIDLKVGRLPDYRLAEFASSAVHIPSGPGFISRAAIAAIGEWAERLASKGVAFQGSPEVVVIDGEEDLLVLPVVFYAPPGTIVYYGQPPLRAYSAETAAKAGQGSGGQAGQGMVEVIVTGEKKKEVADILAEFT